MLGDLHTMMALRRYWKLVAASKTVWLSQFENLNVPKELRRGVNHADAVEDDYVSLAAQWYDQLMDGAVNDGERYRRVAFVEGYVNGYTINNQSRAALCFELAAEPDRTNEEPMANNTVDTENVRFALTSTVRITAMAPTKGIVQALTVIVVAGLGQSGSFLTKPNGGQYRNPQFRGLSDLRPMPDLQNEKVGFFQRQFTWAMARDYIFPPILATPEEPASYSIHDIDSVDQWGNHGRVKADGE